MNSPMHTPPPEALGERVARLEGTMERVLEEVRELRLDFRQLRDEIHREFTEVRRDLRIMSGTLIALAVAVTAAIVNLYR